MIIRINVYKDFRGEWRWTLRSRNQRIIGASTEGYKKRAAALRNLRAVTGLMEDGYSKKGGIRVSMVVGLRRAM